MFLLRPVRGLVLLSALMVKCLLEQMPRVVTYLDKTRCIMGRKQARVHDLANVLLGNLGSYRPCGCYFGSVPHTPFQGNVFSEVFLSFRLNSSDRHPLKQQTENLCGSMKDQNLAANRTWCFRVESTLQRF